MNDVEIYVMNISEVINRPVEKYLKFFSAERQKNILRYKFNADRNRTVWAELLVRYAVSKKKSLPFEKIFVDRDETGKPYLVGKFLEISLSHSGNWVACSFGEIPNGVDVETDSSDNLLIAKKFFSAEEYNHLCSLSAEEGRIQFLKYWTLKESRFKCVGDSDEKNISEKNFLLSDGAVVGLSVLQKK